MSKNRFAGLQAVKKIQENKIIEVGKTLKSKELKKPSVKMNLKPNGNNAAPTVRRGRPSGKRSNAEFQQVTAYVRRDTYRRVSMSLLDRENKGEFSELVEELLQKWLEE